MNKWLVSFSVLLLLLIALIFIFIPSQLSVRKITFVKCSLNGSYRSLSNSNKWKMWWPSGNNNSITFNKSDSFFTHKKCTFRITEKLYNSIQVSIEYREDSLLKSTINIISLTSDSIALEWNCSIRSGLNPLTRIGQYNKALEIKNDMSEVLENLKSFLEIPENIYGIKIKMVSTSDTFLIATKSIYPRNPSTSDIYGLINNLKSYIKNQNAIVTGFPIMNVQQIDNFQFRLMVAVPTNKILNDQGNIFFLRMIPGHFMSTEVKGGSYTVNYAFTQLQLYMSDYKKTAMAIPFKSLITDRSKIIDSMQWITKIYFPVM